MTGAEIVQEFFGGSKTKAADLERFALFAFNRGRIFELEREVKPLQVPAKPAPKRPRRPVARPEPEVCEDDLEDIDPDDAADLAEALEVSHHVLRDKWVQIRKLHECGLCRGEFDAGETMRNRVYTVGSEMHNEYTCCGCENGDATGAGQARVGGSRFDVGGDPLAYN